MATSDNVLTKLHDLLLYIIPQLGKFPRDQKFLLEDRIETKLLDVQECCISRNNNGFRCARGILTRGVRSAERLQGRTRRLHGSAWRPNRKPTGQVLFSMLPHVGTNSKDASGLVAVGDSYGERPGPASADEAARSTLIHETSIHLPSRKL